MAGEWPKTPLSDLTDPDTPVTYGVVKPGDEDPEGVLFIRGGDIAGGRVLAGQLRTISEAVSTQYKRTLLRGGEIVMSLVGNPGQVAIVPKSLRGANIARQAALIRLRPDVDTRFVMYYLGSRLGQEALSAHSRGSVQQVINLRDLKTVGIPTPPLAEQRAIAHILGTLDDKIELNRSMNETLEAIARAIFKSWFVDFDPVRAKASGEPPESICHRLGLTPDLLALFPDRLVDSELGEIPEGWRVGDFRDCCDRIESGGTPSRSVAEYWNGVIPWLTSGEVRDVIVLDTKEKITEAGLNESSAKLWPIGTTVVAMYGATAGQVCLLAEKMTANQACCALIPKPEFLSFVFLTARGSIAQLSDKASGSAQQNLNKSLVANHQLILPPQNVAYVFEQATSCLIAKWISNQREGFTLAVVRDALLPKLLSGELRVSEADSNIEACA